jgi:hypothetical protein
MNHLFTLASRQVKIQERVSHRFFPPQPWRT